MWWGSTRLWSRILRLCSGWLGWRGCFSFQHLVRAPGLTGTWLHASLSTSALSTRRNSSTHTEWTSCSSTTPHRSISGLDEGQRKGNDLSARDGPVLFQTLDFSQVYFALLGCQRLHTCIDRLVSSLSLTLSLTEVAVENDLIYIEWNFVKKTRYLSGKRRQFVLFLKDSAISVCFQVKTVLASYRTNCRRGRP